MESDEKKDPNPSFEKPLTPKEEQEIAREQLRVDAVIKDLLATDVKVLMMEEATVDTLLHAHLRIVSICICAKGHYDPDTVDSIFRYAGETLGKVFLPVDILEKPEQSIILNSGKTKH